MDMKMPNLGGIDATRIIRELVPDVPIIALTAYAYEHDKQAALEAGCNDFLTKPFIQEKLEGNDQEMVVDKLIKTVILHFMQKYHFAGYKQSHPLY